MPSLIYYLLANNVISPQMISCLISGMFIESHPLCNGETEEYRKFIAGDELAHLRSQALSILKYALGDADRTIHVYYWFDPISEVLLKYSPDYCQKWKESGPSFTQSFGWIKTAALKSTDFNTCLSLLESSSPADLKKKHLPSSLTDIHMMVLVRFFELVGYLKDGKITGTGKILSKAFKRSDQFQEELIMAMFLIKSNNLTPKPFSIQYPSPWTHTEEAHIRLICRTLSLLPVETLNSSGVWNGPVDRNILAFNSCSKALHRSFRHLIENILIQLMLTPINKEETMASTLFKSSSFKISQFSEFGKRLPFYSEMGTHMGLLMGGYFHFICHDSSPNRHENSVKQCQVIFGDAILDMNHEIQRGKIFWQSIMDIILGLKSNGAKNVDAFVSANDWVSKIW
jgi:hypothetical protein